MRNWHAWPCIVHQPAILHSLMLPSVMWITCSNTLDRHLLSQLSGLTGCAQAFRLLHTMCSGVPQGSLTWPSVCRCPSLAHQMQAGVHCCGVSNQADHAPLCIYSPCHHLLQETSLLWGMSSRHVPTLCRHELNKYFCDRK